MKLSRPVVVQHHGHLTLTFDFQSQILKMLYLRDGRADWHGMKACESIGCYTHFVTFNVPLTHDLDLGFSRSNLKKPYLRNGMADWHGIKGICVDWMFDPCCDFQCPPHPWPWPWIFKVKFWKCCISGMGWPIDMERKGCYAIECWSHAVTFNVHLFHDLDLGFSMSIFFKSRISGMELLIGMDRKGCESIEC